LNEKFESEASEFEERNYNQVEFKERLSNEGDKPWPWPESLKSVLGKEPNNCALAHCRYKNAKENFDPHVKGNRMVSLNLKVLAKFGLCSNCSQKFDECSLARARKIFATARMLGFSLKFPYGKTY